MERLAPEKIADNIDKWLKVRLRNARRMNPTGESADLFIRDQYWQAREQEIESRPLSLKNRSLRLMAMAAIIFSPVAPSLGDVHLTEPRLSYSIPNQCSCSTSPVELQTICQNTCFWCADTNFPNPVSLPIRQILG